MFWPMLPMFLLLVWGPLGTPILIPTHLGSILDEDLSEELQRFGCFCSSFVVTGTMAKGFWTEGFSSRRISAWLIMVVLDLT